MGEMFGYFVSAFFAVWGVLVIVNTKETANTIRLRLISLLVAIMMFIMSGVVLNATV